MNDLPQHPSATQPRRRRRPLHVWCILAAVLILLGIAAIWAVLGIVHRAEPEARRLVIKSLADRLHCRVELDQLHVSVLRGLGGLQVTGAGLRIESIDGSGRLANSGVPMLTVESFAFHTRLGTLLHDTPGAITVYANNVIVTMPPAAPADAARAKSPDALPGILMLRRVVVHGAKLIFEPAQPTGSPVEFDLSEMDLTDLGDRKAFSYTATLLEDAPIHEVHANGHLGPWLASSPRDTPIDGSFHFDHADLSVIPGLSGTLASTGSFSGTLSHLTAQAAEEIPDFALATSAHPFALTIHCQLQLDNTNGNAIVDSTTAEFLHTRIAANGTVTRTAGGHVIEVDEEIHGRDEDVLVLLSKARPPVLNGALEFHGHLSVPAGEQSVVTRSHLHGTATIQAATWGDPSLQQQVDAISQRAQGKAEVAKGDPKKIPVASASMTTQVAIDNGVMRLTNLVYAMPGASIVMQGSYPVAGTQIELHGVARTAARASQLTTGWKSLLLKPVDPLFSKHGAGAELPVKLVGNLSHPEFGTDFKNRGEDKRKTETVVTKQRK